MPVQDPSSSPAAGGRRRRRGPKRTSSAPIRPADYAHSPAHHCVALRDAAELSAILAGLPPLAHPSRVLTAATAAAREARLASSVSVALDRRDVPGGDTALHLAVRLRLPSLASALAAAGADPTLQNHAGSGAGPAALRGQRFQDFYLEVDFQPPSCRSSPAPAPSDTYRIWKRGADLRADTTLAGFDGPPHPPRRPLLPLLSARRRQPAGAACLPALCSCSTAASARCTTRSRRGAAAGDEDAATSDAAAYRPGLNITAARLVPRTTWLRKEKTESVGEWKARVFDVHNVVFSFRTLKAASKRRGVRISPSISPPETRTTTGMTTSSCRWRSGTTMRTGTSWFADIPPPTARRSCYVPGRRSVAGPPSHMGTPQRRRNSVDVPRRLPPCASVGRGEDGFFGRHAGSTGGAKWKEEETVKTLRPSVWLTEDFPLTVDEFLPLLDILASRVRACAPPSVAIPVVPTVRVVITFTKFVPLIEPEEFFTPMSSPSLLASPGPGSIMSKPDTHKSYLKWSSKKLQIKTGGESIAGCRDNTDPFTVPSDYTWVNSLGSKNDKKSSKSKKGKGKET
ncbi:hypothetical protein PR202_gn00812 [Eleusine coracana subsp. coracana]|uniref:Ankyrin repeat domain-containing protein n=1 Tax=Eleusine coracana subsp. coracana TaxID=191504 RepID=A0AAV5G4A2_ELECO|nr:hypothetical protein PR202_gn00812 [Eleusine coracana subsp. coracana]